MSAVGQSQQDHSGATISVVLATFNGERFLEEQLVSIAQQTRPPDELIISDDGSEDCSVEIVERFSRHAAFPVIVSRNAKRLGFRANFLAGAALAKGDLIAFSDQDDVWLPAKIERCANAMLDRSVTLVCHNALVVDEDRAPLYPLHRAHWNSVDTPTLVDPWSIPVGMSQLFRRFLVNYSAYWRSSVDQNTVTEPMSHDQWFYFLANLFGRVVYLDERLVQYRQHDTNTFGYREAERLAVSRRVARLMEPYPNRFAVLAAVAKNRAQILKEIAFDSHDHSHDTLLEVAQKYLSLAQDYAIRDLIYKEPWRTDRLRRMIDLFRRGAYWTNRLGGFGPRGFVRDFVRAVVLGQS